MAALRKPHRVAFLVPEVTLDGADAAFEREAAALLWTACIETCQRHPGLAVYDPEATPMVSRDGHFAPQHAARGAEPGDAFFGSSRRDELVWLELSLSTTKAAAVRLHALGRDGKRESFDALGAPELERGGDRKRAWSIGERIQQVITAWLAARKLAPLPRPFEAVSADDILGVVRVIAPVLVEQARAWAVAAGGPARASGVTMAFTAAEVEAQAEAEVEAEAEAESESDADAGNADAASADASSTSTELVTDDAIESEVDVAPPRSSVARPILSRLPTALRVPALRLLELALRDDLDDALLAADPTHPKALFAQFRARAPAGKDFALLRRVIAAAPGWARPYAELSTTSRDDDPNDPLTQRARPTDLETVAGAGIAAVCRPGSDAVLAAAGDALRDDGRVDEGIRLLDRAVALHDESTAHQRLVALHRATGRVGATLAHAGIAAQRHGCPMDSPLPWYADQILVDLATADALLDAGRLDEAIALRANRLEDREQSWPRHTRILAGWRKDPRYVAWSYAREGYFRGDDARAVEGFGRVEPGDAVDVAVFLDALVALDRADEVPLAWAQFGKGRRFASPVARLAAAPALFAAGEWRRGIEELWRVELGEPMRDEHTAIARALRLLATAPLPPLEAAIEARLAAGAVSLAQRMARDLADFVPGAGGSVVITAALGAAPAVAFDPAALGGFAPATRARAAIDAMFTEATTSAATGTADTALARADHLVDRWLDVAFTGTSEDDRAGLAQVGAYVAAQAIARYFAATAAPPSPLAGGLRTVAGEALALVRLHRDALADRDARAVLGALDPALRRVERWIGSTWLAAVERSLGIDERSAGELVGFCRDHANVATRIMGPEEAAVLGGSIARLHRDRPDGWAAAVAAQAARLAAHTGYAGSDEWADATVAQLEAGAIEITEAIDALHTAAYFAQGASAAPSVHAARVLFAANRGETALDVLCAGLPAASTAWRDRELPSLGPAWVAAKLDVPFAFEKVATGMFDALNKQRPSRAEKLGRWAVAFEPHNAEAHRNLGLALAQQGKVVDALEHLVRATPEHATQILSGLLSQAGHAAEAMAVLDYASRWYVRADQWLTYGGVAYNAMDNPRTVKAYALAFQLDPDAFNASMYNAYAGVLDEVGDYATCEQMAQRLIRAAGDDILWLTNGWNHLACAYIGQGKFAEAVELATKACAQNPLPDNTAGFAGTLERAKTQTRNTPGPLGIVGRAREPVFALLESGEHAAASQQLGDPSWRVQRGGLSAVQMRLSSEDKVAVTQRARTAAHAILAASDGTLDRDAALCRTLALRIRERAYFARDPVPLLGDRMTRDAFYQEFRARGGVVLGETAPPPPAFVDRVVVAGGKVARASDYVALLRDLAALAPREALAQFDLDDAGYLDVARAWGAALEADPTLAATIDAGLAKR